MADLAAMSVYVHHDAGAAGVQAVADFAKARDLLVMAAPAARRCVLVGGAQGKLRAAFDPIPPALEGRIAAVLGPDRTPPRAALHAGISAILGEGETPQALAAPLGLPAGDGSGHCVGLLSFGGGIDHAALAKACAATGIAVPSPAPHQISVDAASTSAARSDGPLLPMLLVLAALVPKAKIVIYVAPPTLRGWADALSSAIHDADNRPSVVCSGWRPPQPAVMAAALAQQAAALGVQLCQMETDAGTLRLAAGNGQAWTGPAIEAVLQAVSRLRAPPPPARRASEPPPRPARPHYDAVTLSVDPFAVARRVWIAYETDRYPGEPAKDELAVPWRLVMGSMAHDLAVGGDGSLWALSRVPSYAGFALFRWMEFAWRPVGAAGLALAVDGQGLPWLVDAYGTLLRFTGTDWRVVRGGVHDVAIGAQGEIWALSNRDTDAGRAVMHRAAPSGHAHEPGWTEHNTHAARITTAPDGTPWIVTHGGDAMRHQDGAWVHEATNVHDVAIDWDGRIWVVSRCGRRLYRRDGAGQGWRRADGVADRLVARRDGTLWAATPYGFVATGRIAGTPSGRDA